MSGYDDSGYGPRRPLAVVGEGGPAWRQWPPRNEHLLPSDFNAMEQRGIGAPGAGGVPRSDPMMIKMGGVISRPSTLWPLNPDVNGINQAGARRDPQSVISGPPILDPQNRILVPEHRTEHGEFVPAHWQHLPFDALRLRVVVPSQGAYSTAAATGALVRVRGGSPSGGTIVQRDFMLSPGIEAALMAGKYENFSVDVLSMTGNTQLATEWFNDDSGICADTLLWSEVFTVTYGTALIVPPGAVEVFFEAPTFVDWSMWNAGAAGAVNALVPFDRSNRSAAETAGDFGLPVRGQQMVPRAPGGTLQTSVNVQFRLSTI